MGKLRRMAVARVSLKDTADGTTNLGSYPASRRVGTYRFMVTNKTTKKKHSS